MYYSVFMAVCKGIRDSKEEQRRFNDFKMIENHHMLHSSHYLDQMTSAARNKEECESILKHLYEHDAMFVRNEEGEIVEVIESYRDVERKIIDRYWRV